MDSVLRSAVWWQNIIWCHYACLIKSDLFSVLFLKRRQTFIQSKANFFPPARHCDLNMPRCLFSALHWCHVGVLSLQRTPERILLTLASAGPASPSLKLTMPAPSARQRRGLCGVVQICVCVRVCVFCERVRVICKCALVLVPYDSICAFQFQNMALTVLVEWASIQDQ